MTLRHWEEADLRAPAPAGTVLLLPLTDDSGPTGLAEVGWHLHPWHQGRGLAAAAAEAILAAAGEAGIVKAARVGTNQAASTVPRPEARL